jgi:hypothetical protein
MKHRMLIIRTLMISRARTPCFDYTGAQIDTWALKVGVGRTEVRHLAGITIAVIAHED